MKKKFLWGISLSLLCVSSNAFAGEVTDLEWNSIDQIVVTYWSGSSGIFSCTAFNSKNIPIGGGEAYAAGGIARVSITVPKKYVGKELEINCY